MLALSIDKDSRCNVIDTDIPAIGPDDALIKTKACGVCGTDLLKINNKLITAPTVLGHELVGTIVDIGKNVAQFQKGDFVVSAHHVPCFDCHFCRHENYSMCKQFKTTNFVPGGFAECVKLSGEHLRHTTFKVPKTMPWQEAIFMEPLACLVRNEERLPLLAGDCVIVIGLGSIGLMAAKLLKRLNVKVIGVDLDPARCANAHDYGVDFTFDNTGKNFLKAVSEVSHHRADGVLFTSGPSSLINDAMGWIRDGGFLNIFCHLSGERATLDVAQLYHREIQIITTYSPSPTSLKKAFTILQQEDLNLRKMFCPFPARNFAEAITAVNQKKILKALVEF